MNAREVDNPPSGDQSKKSSLRPGPADNQTPSTYRAHIMTHSCFDHLSKGSSS